MIRVTDRVYFNELDDYLEFLEMGSEERKRILRSLPDPSREKSVYWKVALRPKIEAKYFWKPRPESIPDPEVLVFEKDAIIDHTQTRRIVWRYVGRWI